MHNHKKTCWNDTLLQGLQLQTSVALRAEAYGSRH